MDLRLDGLNVLIAGSSKGLGFATAETLLSEGANVCINGRSVENLEESIRKLNLSQNHSKVISFPGDTSNKKTCGEMIEYAAKTFEGIDILITNSGGPQSGSFTDLTLDDWENALSLSFKSHLYLIKYSLPFLEKSKNASVLAVTSFTIKNPLDQLILSNTIRTATAALIKSLSLEMGYKNIRFNSILPGWTRTDRVENLLSVRAEKIGTNIDQELQKVTDSIPMKRMADPKEFANVAAFLVSPAASYVNGVLLTVDGGITKSLF